MTTVAGRFKISATGIAVEELSGPAAARRTKLISATGKVMAVELG